MKYGPRHSLVGGLEHVLFFNIFHTLGIVIPTDSYFSEGVGLNHQAVVDLSLET